MLNTETSISNAYTDILKLEFCEQVEKSNSCLFIYILITYKSKRGLIKLNRFSVKITKAHGVNIIQEMHGVNIIRETYISKDLDSTKY